MQQLELVVAVEREGAAAAESRHMVRGRAQGWGGAKPESQHGDAAINIMKNITHTPYTYTYTHKHTNNNNNETNRRSSEEVQRLLSPLQHFDCLL